MGIVKGKDINDLSNVDKELKAREHQFKPHIFTRGNLNQDLDSQYDTGITSAGISRLQDYRAERQSVADALGNGLVNFGTGIVANTANSIVQTAAVVLGGGVAALSDDVSLPDLLDNPISRFINDISEQVKTNVSPIYQSEEYQKAGLLGKLASQEFWAGSVMDGLAFAGSAYISGMGFSKALGAAAKATGIGQRALQGAAQETFGSALEKGIAVGSDGAGLPTLNMAQKIGASIFSGVSESSVESLDTYKSLKETMTKNLLDKKRREGYLPTLTDQEEEKIDKDAVTAANVSFGLNMLVTGLSDYIQFGKHFAGIADEANNARKIADKVRLGEKGYELAKAEGAAAKFYEKLKPIATALTGAGTEAAEEGQQFLIQKTLENYYAGDDDLKEDLVKSFVSAFKGLSSPEGIESMLAGAVIGGGTTAAKHYLLGGAKADKDQEDKVNRWVQDANEKYNWNSIQAGILKEDTKRGIDAASRNGVVGLAMQEAVKNADGFTFDTLKDINFVDGALHAIRGGKFNDFIDKLNDFANASPTELKELYNKETQGNSADAKNLIKGVEGSDYKALAGELKQKAFKIKDAYDKVSTRHGSNYTEDEIGFIASVNGLVDTTANREVKLKQALEKLTFNFDDKITSKVKSNTEVQALHKEWLQQSDVVTKSKVLADNAKKALEDFKVKVPEGDASSLLTKSDDFTKGFKEASEKMLKLDQQLKDSVDNATYASIYKDKEGKEKISIKADYLKQYKKAKQEFLADLEERQIKDVGQVTLRQDAEKMLNELENIQKLKNQYIELANRLASDKDKAEVRKIFDNIRSIKNNTYLDRLKTIHNQEGKEIKMDTGWYYVQHKQADAKTGQLDNKGKQRTYFKIVGFETEVSSAGKTIRPRVNAVIEETKLDNSTLQNNTVVSRVSLDTLDGRIMKLEDAKGQADTMSEEDAFYIKYKNRVIDYKYTDVDAEGNKTTTTITGVVGHDEKGYLAVAYFDENDFSKTTRYHEIELPDGGKMKQWGSFQVGRAMRENFSEDDFFYNAEQPQYLKIYTEAETQQWLELQSVNRAIIGVNNDIESTLKAQDEYVMDNSTAMILEYIQTAFQALPESDSLDAGSEAYHDLVVTLMEQNKNLSSLSERLLARKTSFETALTDLRAKLAIAQKQLASLSKGKLINIDESYSSIKQNLDNKIKAIETLISEYATKDTEASKYLEVVNRIATNRIKKMIADSITDPAVLSDNELSSNITAAIQSIDMIGIEEDFRNNKLTVDQSMAIAEYLLSNPNDLKYIDLDGKEVSVRNTFFERAPEIIGGENTQFIESVQEELDTYKNSLNTLYSTIQGKEAVKQQAVLRAYKKNLEDNRASLEAVKEAEKNAKTPYRERLSSNQFKLPEEIVLEQGKQRKLELLAFESALLNNIKNELFPNKAVDLENMKEAKAYVEDITAPRTYSSDAEETANSRDDKRPSILENPIKSITSSNVPERLGNAKGNDQHHWAFAKVLDNVNLASVGRIHIQWRTSAPEPINGVLPYEYKEDYGTGHKNIIGVLVYDNGQPVRVNSNGEIVQDGKLLAITHLEEPTDTTSGGYTRFREVDDIAELNTKIQQARAAFSASPTEANEQQLVSLEEDKGKLQTVLERGLKSINDYRQSVINEIADNGSATYAIQSQSFGIPVLSEVPKSLRTIFGKDLASKIFDGTYEIIVARGTSHPKLGNKVLKAGRSYLLETKTGKAFYLNTQKLSNDHVEEVVKSIIELSVIDETTFLKGSTAVKSLFKKLRKRLYWGLEAKYPDNTIIKDGKRDTPNSKDGDMRIYSENESDPELSKEQNEAIAKEKLYVVGFVPNSRTQQVEYGLWSHNDQNGKAVYDTKIVNVSDLKLDTDEAKQFRAFLRNRYHQIPSKITTRLADGKSLVSEWELNEFLDDVFTSRIAPPTQIQFKSTYIVPSTEPIRNKKEEAKVEKAFTDISKIKDPVNIFNPAMMDTPLIEAPADGTEPLTINTILKKANAAKENGVSVDAVFGGIIDSFDSLLKDYQTVSALNYLIERTIEGRKKAAENQNIAVSLSSITPLVSIESLIKPELLQVAKQNVPAVQPTVAVLGKAPVQPVAVTDATAIIADVLSQSPPAQDAGDGSTSVTVETNEGFSTNPDDLTKKKQAVEDDGFDLAYSELIDTEPKLTEQEFQDLKKSPNADRLKKYGVELNLVRGLIAGRAFGQFNKAMNKLGEVIGYEVSVSDKAPIGTIYHEEFHVVEKLFLSDKARKNIYDEWRTLNNRPNAEYEEVSEALAEEFRYYAVNRDVQQGKFRQYIKYLFNRVFKMLEFLTLYKSPAIKNVFDKIYDGTYANSVTPEIQASRTTPRLSINQKQDTVKSMTYRYFDLLNGQFKTKDGLVELDVFSYLNDNTTRPEWGNKTYRDVANDVIGELVKNFAGESFDDKLFSFLLHNIRLDLIKAGNSRMSDLLAAVPTQIELKTRFYDYINKYNNNITTVERQAIKDVVEDDLFKGLDLEDDAYDPVVAENEATNRDSSVEQIPSNEVDSKKNMSMIVKQLLLSVASYTGNTNAYQLNSLGLKEHTAFSSTINALYRDLSDIDSIDEVFQILERKASSAEEGSILYKEIAKRLKGTTKAGNTRYLSSVKEWEVQNAFRSQFAKTNIDLLSVKLDENGFELYNETQRAAVKKQFDKIRAVILRKNLTTEQVVTLLSNKDLESFLKSLNLTLPIKLSLKSRSADLAKVQELLDDVANTAVFNFKNAKKKPYKALSEWSKFRKLLVELNKHDNQVPSFSVTNAQNKKVYSIQQQNYLTKTVKMLRQRGMEIEGAIKRTLTTAESNALKQANSGLFSLYNLRNISVKTLVGFKGTVSSEKANQLTDGDMLFMFSNLAFNNLVPFIFPADKSTYNVLDGMISFRPNVTGADISNLYLEQLREEVKEAYYYTRASSAKPNKNLFPVTQSILQATNSKADVDSRLKYILSLITDDESSSIENMYKDLQINLLSSFNGFLEKELGKLEDMYMKTGVGVIDNQLKLQEAFTDSKRVYDKDSSISNTQVMLDMLHFQTANMLIQGKYIVGGLSNYKGAADFAKRSAGALATKSTYRLDSKFLSEFDEYSKYVYQKANSKLKPLMFNNGTEKATFRALVVDDVKVDSRFNKAVSKLKDEYKAAYEAYGVDSKNNPDIDITDAQGFEHLDSIRFRAISEGRWGDDMEDVYIKDLQGKASIKDILSITTEKTQYYGKQYLPDLHEGEDVLDNSNNATFYKLSIIPISRSLSKQFPDTVGKIDEFMRRSNNPLMMVNSANKVGRVLVDKKGISLKFALDPNNAETVEKFIQTSYWEDYGTQVDIARVDKTKQTKATQHRKLILLNTLRKGGILHIDGKELSARAIYDKLNSLESTKMDVLVDDMQKEIKATLDANGNIVSTDLSVLASSIISQLEERESPANIIKSVASTLAMGRGIDLVMSKGKIESIATAFVNKVIKQKVSGTSLPQSANVFDRVFESGDLIYNKDGTRTPITDENGKVIDREELKFYDDGYLEVYLPNQYKKFFNVNNFTGDNEKLLTMLGFRIPVQGHNSMERIRVKGFLPANLGNMIVVPYEITKKAGSDFDIDKLNLYTYAVDKEGNIIPDFTTEEEFATKYPKDDKNYNKYKAKALDNAMLTAYLEVLGTEEVQNMMLLPIVESDLKAAVDDVRGIRGTSGVTFANYFNPATNVAMKTSFEGGKKVLGSVALHNTHHSLSQFAQLAIDLKLNFSTYNTTKTDGYGSSLTSMYDTDTLTGELISDSISQLMSAAVDVAKDDYIKDINLTLSTSSVYLFLVRCGVPLKDVVFFMSQPVITQYVDLVNLYTSNYYSTLNGEISSFEASDKAVNTILKSISTSNKTVLQSKFTTTSLKEGLTDNINSSTQYNILSEFLKYKQQADVLSQFMNVTSYDTKGIETSLIGAVSQKEQYEKVIQRLKEAGNKTSMLFNTVGTTGMDGFFNYYNEDKQYQQTFLGKMQEIVFKSENILTPIYTDAFKYAVDIMKQYNIKTNSSNLVNKYTSIINGVINTTLANMKLGDSSIQRRSDALFTGANSLANRILEIRDKRKDMKFLEALSIDAEDDIHTISLQNSNSLDTFESSDLTDSFYELEGVYPDIANDLIDAVILQSGVSNNPLTYYGIIPFEKIMERVGQYYQNDYFHSTYKDIVILNDYKKLLEFGSGVTMENRAYTKPRKAYYEKADKKGDILRIYLNGNVYLDYGGVIKTKEGETLLEITNAKKDYKSGASMFGKAYEPTIDNTSTYAKYVGMSRKEVQPSELDKFVLDNADAINKGLITKEQVDYYANNC